MEWDLGVTRELGVSHPYTKTKKGFQGNMSLRIRMEADDHVRIPDVLPPVKTSQ